MSDLLHSHSEGDGLFSDDEDLFVTPGRPPDMTPPTSSAKKTMTKVEKDALRLVEPYTIV